MLGLFITLAGCGKYMPAPNLTISLPAVFGGAAPGVVSQALPDNETWWRTANDPTLNTLLESIATQNLSLEQAQYRLQAARQSTDSAAYLPRVNSQTGAEFTNRLSGQGVGDAANGTFRAGADMTWEMPLFGQYGAARSLDKAAVAFAKADLAAVRASVNAEAVQTYADLRATQQRLVQLERIVSAQQTIVSLTQIQEKAGLAGLRETQEAQQTLANTLSEQSQARTQLDQSMRALAVLTGTTTLEPAWKAYGAVPVFQSVNLAQTPADVLRNRPDIRRSEADVLSAAARLKLAKAERWPQINFTGSIAQVGNVFGSSVAGVAVNSSAAPTLTIPLLDWHSRLGRARQQDAQLAEAASVYRATLVAAFHEVEGALKNQAETTSQVLQTQTALGYANAQLANTELLFERGIINALDKAEVSNRNARAHIEAETAKANAAKAKATLVKALGGGLHTPEQAPIQE